MRARPDGVLQPLMQEGADGEAVRWHRPARRLGAQGVAQLVADVRSRPTQERATDAATIGLGDEDPSLPAAVRPLADRALVRASSYHLLPPPRLRFTPHRLWCVTHGLGPRGRMSGHRCPAGEPFDPHHSSLAGAADASATSEPT